VQRLRSKWFWILQSHCSDQRGVLHISKAVVAAPACRLLQLLVASLSLVIHANNMHLLLLLLLLCVGHLRALRKQDASTGHHD
jgi:hypothetical protein